MRTPTDVLRYYLVLLGLVTSPDDSLAWPCYVSSMPDTPDDCVCLYDTAGVLQGRDMPTGTVAESYGVQIKLRAVDYPTGYNKLLTTCQGLDNVVTAGFNQNLLVAQPWIDSGIVYGFINASRKSGVMAMGGEVTGSRLRGLWSANYTFLYSAEPH